MNTVANGKSLSFASSVRPAARISFVLSAVVLGTIVLCALFAPLLAPYDPLGMQYTEALHPPGPEHVMGTDQFGRDIFSRIIHGAAISLQVAVIAVLFSAFCGSIIGLVAGFFGGWVDEVASRCIDVLFSLPDILLALAIMAIAGQNRFNVMLAVGIVYTPIFARIVRSVAMQTRRLPYVEASRAMGAGPVRLMLMHIYPRCLTPLLVQCTLSLAFAVLAEATLSFLGLGVEPDAPSWGIMLGEGKDFVASAWWIAVFPGAAIFVCVLAFNIAGDYLRTILPGAADAS